MVEVRWEDFEEDPAGFERLAKQLVTREFPGAICIDGRGGDGGIDARWNGPDGLVIIEMKKFTRINATGRRQIKRSLTRAAEHRPSRWILVVPTDPTPSLDRWFHDELSSEVPFGLEWRGRAWLDQLMAAHPDIRRATRDSAHAEVLRAVSEARAEMDFLNGGVPDFARRAAALHRRGSELSPTWNVRWDESAKSVVVEPKPGALKEDLRAEFTFDFPTHDTEAQETRQRYERTIALGGTVTVPAQYVTRVSNAALQELGIPAGSAELTFEAVENNEGLPMGVTLRVTGGGKAPTRPLHVTMTRREVGTQGVTVHGRDATGLLTVQLVMYRPVGPQVRMSANLALDDGSTSGARADFFDPEILLRINEFFAGIDVGRQAEITLPGGQFVAPLTTPADLGFAKLRDLLRDLVNVRDTVGAALLAPHTWTIADQRVIGFAASLVRDGQARVPWRWRPSVVQSPTQFLHTADLFGPDGAHMRVGTSSLPLTFNGMTFDCGPVRIDWERAVITNADTCHALARAGTTVEPVFAPAPGSAVFVSTAPLDELGR